MHQNGCRRVGKKCGVGDLDGQTSHCCWWAHRCESAAKYVEDLSWAHSGRVMILELVSNCHSSYGTFSYLRSVVDWLVEWHPDRQRWMTVSEES